MELQGRKVFPVIQHKINIILCYVYIILIFLVHMQNYQVWIVNKWKSKNPVLGF